MKFLIAGILAGTLASSAFAGEVKKTTTTTKHTHNTTGVKERMEDRGTTMVQDPETDIRPERPIRKSTTTTKSVKDSEE